MLVSASGYVPDLGALGQWVAQVGGILGILSVAFLSLLWTWLAHRKTPIVFPSNTKRGISIIFPIVLAFSWYGVSAYLGSDTLNWSRVVVWASVGIFAATGKQIGYFIYEALRGTPAPDGKDTPTWEDIVALVQNTDWLKVLQSAPANWATILIALGFGGVSVPAPVVPDVPPVDPPPAP